MWSHVYGGNLFLGRHTHGHIHWLCDNIICEQNYLRQKQLCIRADDNPINYDPCILTLSLFGIHNSHQTPHTCSKLKDSLSISLSIATQPIS